MICSFKDRKALKRILTDNKGKIELEKGPLGHYWFDAREDVSFNQRKEYIELMNMQMQELLPNGIEVSAYFEHDTKLPVSQTAFKAGKYKNG